MARRPRSEDPGLDVAVSQQRSRRAEERPFHAAIVALRKAGRRVYRAGRNTVLIDGERHPIAVVLDKTAGRGDGRR